MINLHNGDCLDVLRQMPENSVDSIVTDPPYGLSFMGKHWDYDVPKIDIWRECLRVLKPGGHLLAFSGTRTQHRMAVNIEDAGFEIRDMIAWVYGSGFPKSLDVSKAIDKAAGAERKVIGFDVEKAKQQTRAVGTNSYGDYAGNVGEITAHATPEAEQWQGWGTALKPAIEPITLARKPLAAKTVAANVLAHGTGAMNIDACRVPLTGATDAATFENNHRVTERLPANFAERKLGLHEGGWKQRVGEAVIPPGRWPANLIHDGSEEVLAAFPYTKARGNTTPTKRNNSNGVMGWGIGKQGPVDGGDAGNAARFFYCSKASSRDRNAGCERSITWENVDLTRELQSVLAQAKATYEAITCHPGGCECFTTLFGKMPTGQYLLDLKSTIETVTKLITVLKTSNFYQDSNTSANIQDAIKHLMVRGLSLAENADSINLLKVNTTNEKMVSVLGAVVALLKTLSSISEKGKKGNAHSTVKPTDLMRYLCKLVTPAGGIVLDPFMGSGSTGKAAVLDGFRFIGIEREAEYYEISKARIAAASIEGLA